MRESQAELAVHVLPVEGSQKRFSWAGASGRVTPGAPWRFCLRRSRKMASTMDLFKTDRDKHIALAAAWVVPEPSRCVQCGVCSFHCPMEIDVRRHVWRAEPVVDSHCLTCGECVKRCPRGLLRFETIASAPRRAPRDVR